MSTAPAALPQGDGDPGPDTPTSPDEGFMAPFEVPGLPGPRKYTPPYRSDRPAEVPDLINEPPHYTAGGIESIDYIESKGHGEGFCAGNALKYLARYKLKGTPVEDLKKARWYLDRLIGIVERG